MGKRNAPKQDDSSHLPWQNFKAIIITLYSSENQSLQETMETLANDYNFYATPKQYRTKLREWGIKKNVDSADMETVLKIVDTRWREEGKRTEVVCWQRVVPEEKMTRYMRENNIENIPDSPIGTVPDHIHYYTPEPEDPTTPVATLLGLEVSGTPTPNRLTPFEPLPRVALFLNAQEKQILHQILEREDLHSASDYIQTPPNRPVYGPLTPASVTSPPNHPDDALQRLQDHVTANDTASILNLIRGHQTFDLKSDLFSTCLQIASKLQNSHIFQILIFAALSVDEAATCSETTLTAAQNALQPLITLLLRAHATDFLGFLFRARMISIESARHLIMYQGLMGGDTAVLHQLLSDYDQICYLLDLDAMIQNASAIRESIIFHGADAARIVMHAAFDVGLVSNGNASALHLAVVLLLYEETEYLLNCGAQVNQALLSGQTPLHLLCNMPQCAVMPLARLLIARGAEIQSRDLILDNCLHTLVRHPRQLSTMMLAQVLVEAGIDVDAVGCGGDTARAIVERDWPADHVAEAYDVFL